MKKSPLLVVILSAVCPVFVYANNIGSLISGALNIVNGLIQITFVLAILFFFWSMFTLIRTSSEIEKTEARNRVMYGLIVLFVMTSIWGITYFIGVQLGIKEVSTSGYNSTDSTYFSNVDRQAPIQN